MCVCVSIPLPSRAIRAVPELGHQAPLTRVAGVMGPFSWVKASRGQTGLQDQHPRPRRSEIGGFYSQVRELYSITVT